MPQLDVETILVQESMVSLELAARRSATYISLSINLALLRALVVYLREKTALIEVLC